MFSTLRQDSLLYVIDKNGEMRFSVVRNPKPSAPYPKFKTAIPMPNTPMLVDVDAEDGTGSVKFTELPAAMTSHESNGIFVTESKEEAQAELEAMAAKSRAVIESVPWHEKVAAFCENTLPQVNPGIAQDRDRDNRLSSLEKKMDSIEALMSEMSGTLKSLKPQQQ